MKRDLEIELCPVRDLHANLCFAQHTEPTCGFLSLMVHASLDPHHILCLGVINRLPCPLHNITSSKFTSHKKTRVEQKTLYTFGDKTGWCWVPGLEDLERLSLAPEKACI